MDKKREEIVAKTEVLGDAPAERPGTPQEPVQGRKPRVADRGPKAKRGEVRSRILEVAREEFLEKGYEGATVRNVARRAGCDSALVAYYFGAKQRLFRECFNLPMDPAQAVLEQILPGREGAGERLVDFMLTMYEEHLTGETMGVLMRALVTDTATVQRFRNYMRSDVISRVGEELGGKNEIAGSIELAMATLYGVATMRYIIKLEPLASMPRERLLRELAPIVQQRIDHIYAYIKFERSAGS